MFSESTFALPNTQPRTRKRAELVQWLNLSLSIYSKPAEIDFSAYAQYIRSTPIAAEYISEYHIASVSSKKGAYGSVHLCRNHKGTEFALKTVKTTDEKVLKMTIREFETLHPHIVGVCGLFLLIETQEAAILMDFLPGKSLSELLAAGRRFTGRHYAEREIKSLAKQLFSALMYLAGQGFVHREVNPANIVLAQEHATLVDFQTAVNLSHAATTPKQMSGRWGKYFRGCSAVQRLPAVRWDWSWWVGACGISRSGGV